MNDTQTLPSFESILNTQEIQSYFDQIAALESIREELQQNVAINKTPSQHILNAIGYATSVVAKTDLNDAKGIISLEHHESVYDRNNRLKLAIEAIGEDIKNIVLKIVEWIKQAANKIALHFDDVYKGAMAQYRKASAVHDAAISAKIKYGPMRADTKFSSDKSFVKVLGQTDYGHLSATYKQQMQEFASDFNRAKMITAVGAVRDLVSKVGQYKTTEISNDDLAELVENTIDKLLTTIYHSFTGGGDEKRYGGLVGDVYFDLSISKVKDHKTGIAIEMVSTDNTGANLHCLNCDDIIHLSSLVIHFCKKGVFPDYVDVAKSMSALSSEIERICSAIVKKHTVYNGDIVSLHMVKKLTQTLMKTSQLIYVYNAKVSAGINAYCIESLKEMEKHYIPEE